MPATVYLTAVIEGICIREMQAHTDQLQNDVVGRCIHLEHRAPVPAGAMLRVSGWTERIGTHSATFFVRAYDQQELVCEVRMTLASADRKSLELKIAGKISEIEKPAI